MSETLANERRKPRADGQRNRAKILDAAKQVLTKSGAAASMDDVAQLAGVGNGTLYRHFPTRAALIEAVCREDARGLVAAAVHLAATQPPLDALVAWMNEFVRCIATRQIAAETTDALLSTTLDGSDPSCADVGSALTMLFDRAVADGQVTVKIDPLDLVRAVTGVATISPQAGWEDNAKRLIGAIVAGLGRSRSPDRCAPAVDQ